MPAVPVGGTTEPVLTRRASMEGQGTREAWFDRVRDRRGRSVAAQRGEHERQRLARHQRAAAVRVVDHGNPALARRARALARTLAFELVDGRAAAALLEQELEVCGAREDRLRGERGGGGRVRCEA